ncbi:MAG: M48 family metallopeptidase [Lachnospiraceae bacterium]|nr:M48 family metallopeptidase [Lachnospiraceae bacterium]
MMTPDCPDFACTVRRSKRKTMALEVTPDGDLIIRAPLRTPEAEILAFARQNREWIAEKVTEAGIRKKEREDYEREHPVQVLSERELRELGRAAEAYLPMRTAHFAAIMGVDFGKITIRNQTTRWGSCSAKKNLNFNVLLMLTPREVIDSVIIHELCHLRHMNHSKAFYEEVLRYCPDYRKWDRWLKDNGAELMRRIKKR